MIAMKKLLRILIVLLLLIIIAAAVVLGMFYKKASPTLMIDLSKKADNAKQCVSVIDPKYKSEEEIQKNQSSLTPSWWVSKWHSDMKKNAVKSIHYDFTDTDFKDYLKKIRGMNFDGFTGFASLDKNRNQIDILCADGKKKSSVVIYGFGKTKLSGKTLEIKIEEAVYKGESETASLPVVLRHYTTSAADKLEIDFDKPDEDNVYHITITEADPTAAPAYENPNPPVSFVLKDDLTAEFSAPEDGAYRLDYVLEKAEKDAEYDVFVDGKAAKSGSVKAGNESFCSSVDIDLKKGSHSIQLKSDEAIPKLKKLIVSPVDDSVYTVQKSKQNGVQKLTVAVTADAKYSLTSTNLSSNITVNSKEYPVNQIGGAIVELKQGFNEIEYKSDSDVELNITKTEE